MEDSVFVKVLPYITSIKNELLNLKEQHPDFQPVVTVIQLTSGAESAGSDSFTTSLVKSVLTQCGITINCIQVLPESETSSVINIVQKLNCDQNVHGIIVQLPHDYDDSSAILDAITPSKDVAGVCQKNIENFDLNEDESFLSCAASAVVELIKNAGLLLENANVFVLGKERIIFPISKMLLSKNAVVSVCRTADESIPIGVKDSDVIIITSKPTNDLWRHNKPGAVIIECGAASEGGDIQHNTDLNKNKFHYISSSCFWNMFAVMIAKNMLLATKMLFESKWNLKIIPLKFGPPGLSDIEIARSQNLKDIGILAKEIGLLPYEIELYGDRKAKISLSVLDRFKFRSPGKYVVVSGINPTSFGEGKSTTSVGLCQALAVQMKRNAMVCLRQPSQGPTFGIKGGAAGGGYSQVVPMEEFNLHLTGDIHAVTAANNLLAAQLDARIFHEATQSDESLFQRLVKTVKGKKVFTKIQLARLQRLGIHKTDPTSLDKDEISRFVRLDIDPSTITWHRVIDTNDRFLRKIAIGLSQTEKKMVRETQFDISVASEIMAILALTTDMADMKEKLSKMVVANDKKGNPVTADDLGATGALAILLKDAIRPNLMQTLEGAPVFVHAGPFANIAHGNSSVIADKIALKIVGENGYVVTEAGFGSDIGLEKFCNIKCRYSGLIPNAVVIVATIRAIKLHGGGPNIGASSSLPKEYTEENIALVEKGFCNLAKHIQIANKFGLPVIVALNRFNTDTEAELNLLKELSEKNGAFRCVICSHFSEGSKGAKQLAEAVITACNQASKFNLLYDLKTPLEHKIRVIAEQIYGAEGVQFKSEAKQMLELFEKQGFGDLAICMAKTPFSLSDDATKKGVPENFTVTVQDVKLSAGAGYVYPLLGSVLTMPALSTRPCIYDMDIDSDNGNIEGLF